MKEWIQALDENKNIAAILMDLSKGLDCHPHDLLINKTKIVWSV